MFNLGKSIAEWREQMLAAGITFPVPLEELEIHLREEIERQMKSGLNEAEAFDASVEKIGESHTIQNEFNKVKATREVIKMLTTALGVALMLVGIPFVTGLGFALLLFVTVDGLLKVGRRKHAWFLFLSWTAWAIFSLACRLQDGTLAQVFIRKPLPLWYRAIFVCIWLGCAIGHFRQQRKKQKSDIMTA